MLVFTPVINAFRFYEEGTESGSAAIAAQDTNITRLVDSNSQLHLRYRIQETGGAAGAVTDDYQLQYSKNAGAFTNVTATSANVQADPTATPTDGGSTTNRATDGIADGTGGFVGGEIDKGNGQITDWGHSASAFSELLWCVLLVAADLADADTLDFRVTLNGGAPGMSNTVTPRITADKTPGVVSPGRRRMMLLGAGHGTI